MNPNPDYLHALRDSVRDAPDPNLIGLTIAALDFDSCVIALSLGERHVQPFGIVHGCVLATLVDTATFWAGFLRLPDDAGLPGNGSKLGGSKVLP
jgi:acyl-coenzyme A thioesterase PaaI-like protein